MIEGRYTRSWPLWAKLVFIALPAGGVAAAGFAATLSLTTTLTGSLAENGVIVATAYDLARVAARYAVFVGAPAAVLALVGLLLVGGYGHYPDGIGSRDYVPSLLGRIVLGSTVFAGLGLFCQLMLAAQVGGWSPL